MARLTFAVVAIALAARASAAPPIELKGHTATVTSLSLTADGRRLASASFDKTARIWMLPQGRLIRTIRRTQLLRPVLFSPDGRTLLIGGRGRQIDQLDPRDGELSNSLVGHAASTTSLVCSPDGKLMVSGSDDRTARIWNVSSGKTTRTLRGHGGSVEGVAISADRTLVATGSTDRTIKIWQQRSGMELHTFAGHKGAVFALAFNRDKTMLASGSQDGTLRIWRIEDGTVHTTLTAPKGSWVTAVAWDAVGVRVAYAAGKEVRIAHYSTGKVSWKAVADTSQVMALAWDARAGILAAAGKEGVIRVWKVK